MESADLGQRIADAVVTRFMKIGGKAGKPVTRLNGIEEWTVLAGLVAVDFTTKKTLDSPENIQVLCVATGVKAMPDSVRQYSQGSVVHDMHAEILCLRMFNRYLMEEIKDPLGRKILEEVAKESEESESNAGSKLESDSNTESDSTDSTESSDSDKFENKNPTIPVFPRLRLKPSLKLALYISEPPCGDASMAHIANGQESWTDMGSNEEPAAKKQKLVRGRANFNDVGVVRTKPGRADSQVSYSKSCSDKLCLKQYTGILNCITSQRIEPVFLKYLVVDASKYHTADFHRCFSGRLSQLPPHPLSALTFPVSHYKYAKTPGKVPLPLSLVYCASTNTLEVLNMGAKNGGYVKNRRPKPTGTSILCRQNLWAQAQSEIPVFASYKQLKNANFARQRLKQTARTHMGLWPECCADDEFAI